MSPHEEVHEEPDGQEEQGEAAADVGDEGESREVTWGKG